MSCVAMDAQKVLRYVGKELGRDLIEIDNLIGVVCEKNWFDTTESLAKLPDSSWAAMGIPLRFAQEVKAKLRHNEPEKPEWKRIVTFEPNTPGRTFKPTRVHANPPLTHSTASQRRLDAPLANSTASQRRLDTISFQKGVLPKRYQLVAAQNAGPPPLAPLYNGCAAKNNYRDFGPLDDTVQPHFRSCASWPERPSSRGKTRPCGPPESRNSTHKCGRWSMTRSSSREHFSREPSPYSRSRSVDGAPKTEPVFERLHRTLTTSLLDARKDKPRYEFTPKVRFARSDSANTPILYGGRALKWDETLY